MIPIRVRFAKKALKAARIRDTDEQVTILTRVN